MQTRLEEIVTQNSGMLLVTGPTGSGKTTTLYACLNRIRSSQTKIITLEDPIEYELMAGKSREGGITQVQVNPKIGLTFVEGLKASLRQDPDIIFVGEVRDKESAEIAFTAALTGHFVLTSLHTIGAPATITRLLDMGVEPFLMVSTLKGVVAQRLVRVLCPHCKEPYHPPQKLLEKFKVKAGSDTVFYRPKGCPWCAKSGYRGRRGIYELMEVTDELRNLMLNRAPNASIFDCAKRSGMMTLRQSGLEAVIQGVTTMAEVLRVAPHE
jgi:type II secretory ATPase GspE/PulE/Tfp pilus assembly ATPase PilB-like protein